ncbi:MAG: hypothetical protein K2K57_07970 [Oscillospiraceae bacterium]|nr:hypothetical protein [Oscillospiraceae bacterium]
MGFFDLLKRKKGIKIEDIMGEKYEQIYFEECKFIWKNYVPKSGQADNLQGELLREIEKLRREAQDNGNINWDGNFEYFCDFISDTLCGQPIFSDEEKEKISVIMGYFKECGIYAFKFNNGEISDEEFDVMKLAYTEDNLYDIICDKIGQMYKNDPAPIPYEKNEKIYR